jgi:excinuclease ABC subunit A
VTVRGARLHNLQGIDVTFPAGALTAVTGISGAGKSTLVQEVLGPSLVAHAQGRGPVGCAAIEPRVELADVLALEQGAAALGSGSTVATFLGIAERLRERFAKTPEAKARKLTAKHFSTASPGGRCEACEGRGSIVVAMDLLPDVTVGCEECEGRRFQAPVLECRIEGKNIAELLESPVEAALAIFGGDRVMAGPLRAMTEIGLGYLRLGQEGSKLSAGESQRLRLARLLAEPPAGRAAILLDEPTRGMGFEDVERLIAALRRLVGAGHLVVVVEHDPELIAAADWIVELDAGRVVRPARC